MDLDALVGWSERNRERLNAAEIAVTLSETSPRDKPSRTLSLSSPRLEADVMVWITGECDVVIGHVASGDTDVVHHEFASDDELFAALEAICDRFGADAQAS